MVFSRILNLTYFKKEKDLDSPLDVSYMLDTIWVESFVAQDVVGD